jgi:hypothetical protein
MTKPLVDEPITTISLILAMAPDAFYRAALPLSRKTLTFTAGIIRRHRAAIGSLWQAVRDAKKAGLAYVVLDGTLIPIDRVAADRPFYSGRHKEHGMNLQVIASPDGDILWVSGTLPGSVHDKKAEWLADKGYQGSMAASRSSV